MAKKMGMGGHQSTKMVQDEWLTPPHIIKSLGAFDLDPCAPVPESRPWDTATTHYDKNVNGLGRTWAGRVWCNPPYGTQTKYWLQKCATHDNAIALIFARTETEMFFNHVWGQTSALLFIKKRVTFHYATGEKATGSGGAPSVLIAYGLNNAIALRNSGIRGAFIDGTTLEVI